MTAVCLESLRGGCCVGAGWRSTGDRVNVHQNGQDHNEQQHVIVLVFSVGSVFS